ncbi:MAG: choline/ethanolamine kinase family protein [Chloroflexota bacterium]
MPLVNKILSKIGAWQGKSLIIEPISGGLTNSNYKVTVEGIPYFVRVPGESTNLLAIDRKNEYYNSKAASQSGIGPKVIYHLPEFDVMVLEFLDGKTMSKYELNVPGMPKRIAKSIKQLHAGPRFLNDFNMFRLTEYYIEICKKHDIRMPLGFLERLATVNKIEEALSVHPVVTLPCNNDLLAENYIDDGTCLHIIDYEYSGNNDPYFELGNTSQELEYNEDQIRELCQEYFGIVTEAKLARMKLNMIMSDVGWTLWAAIQAKISKIQYDFWGWAIERWGRAVEKLDSGEFPLWLIEVRR